MLRREGRDALKLKLLIGQAQGISDGKNARIKHTNDIACICLLDDLSVLRHHLLRLGQADFLAALHMVYFHAGLELAGYNTHKRNTVTVRLVHVRLNLKDESRKIIVKRAYLTGDGLSRQRGSGHLQEMLQEGLYTKVGQCGTEKYRG